MAERIRFSPALTGRAHGLPVATVIALLGAEQASRRISAALGT